MKGMLTKERLKKGLLCLLCAGFLLIPSSVYADEEHGDYASAKDMATEKEVVQYGMTPIAGSLLKDGSWDIEVKSSSSFFKVESCELTIKDGQMTARMTMSSYSYILLFMGTAEDAAAAPYEDYIEYENENDWYVFTVPVKALNQSIDCAAYSKRKKMWYNRKILFDASTLTEEALNGLELPDYDVIEKALDNYDGADLVRQEEGNTAASEEENAEAVDVNLKDGKYSINVAMTGGSGRAAISTPTLMIVEDGKAYARLLWSSSHYDWMEVGGVRYLNETTDGGNSTFTIPITALDSVIPVVADTVAMGDPVAIKYSLTFYRESIGDVGLIPQEAAKKVVIFALIIIVGGFLLNLFVKKRKKRKNRRS